jgi:hypothetical protein
MNTYEQTDARRRYVQWKAQNTIMLGTQSDAGNVRRMDGTRVLKVETHAAFQHYIDAFIQTGKWEHPLPSTNSTAL